MPEHFHEYRSNGVPFFVYNIITKLKFFLSVVILLLLLLHCRASRHRELDLQPVSAPLPGWQLWPPLSSSAAGGGCGWAGGVPRWSDRWCCGAPLTHPTAPYLPAAAVAPPALLSAAADATVNPNRTVRAKPAVAAGCLLTHTHAHAHAHTRTHGWFISYAAAAWMRLAAALPLLSVRMCLRRWALPCCAVPTGARQGSTSKKARHAQPASHAPAGPASYRNTLCSAQTKATQQLLMATSSHKANRSRHATILDGRRWQEQVYDDQQHRGVLQTYLTLSPLHTWPITQCSFQQSSSRHLGSTSFEGQWCLKCAKIIMASLLKKDCFGENSNLLFYC